MTAWMAIHKTVDDFHAFPSGQQGKTPHRLLTLQRNMVIASFPQQLPRKVPVVPSKPISSTKLRAGPVCNNTSSDSNLLPTVRRVRSWRTVNRPPLCEHDTRHPRIVKNIRWMFSAILFLWAISLVVSMLLLVVSQTSPKWLTAGASNKSAASACRPDGSFNLRQTDFNRWNIRNFVQITFGLGPMSFTEAKLIDILWDLVSIPVYLSPDIPSYELSLMDMVPTGR